MPAPMMLPSRGWTRLNVSETERSAFPSRTSLTASISAPCSQYQPTKLTIAPRSAPNQPRRSASTMPIAATTTKTTSAISAKWLQCLL